MECKSSRGVAAPEGRGTLDRLKHLARAAGRVLLSAVLPALLVAACEDAELDTGDQDTNENSRLDATPDDARPAPDRGSDAGRERDAADAEASTDAEAGDASDLDADLRDAAPQSDLSAPDGGAPLPPAAARPPAPPPDAFDLVQAVANEHPDQLANSCGTQGGTFEFLQEVVRRCRARDPRWGFVRRNGAIQVDRIGYFWDEGTPDDRTEIYVIDVITRACGTPGVDDPPGPGWNDDTAGGGRWSRSTDASAEPMDAGADAGPPTDAMPADVMPADQGQPPGDLPLPDESEVVAALAAEHPDLLAASCIPEGGNNLYLFELVRRLRQRDRRWGLNWKRGNEGDMSQDVVDYYYGPDVPGGDYEGRTEVYIIDVISGHCGPDPGVTWIDQTEVTRLGGTIGRWTLQPLPPAP